MAQEMQAPDNNEYKTPKFSDLSPIRLFFMTNICWAAESVVYYPLWTLKTIQQTDLRPTQNEGALKSLLADVQHIPSHYKAHGIRGFYRGFVGMAGLSVLPDSLWMFTYLYSKEKARSYFPERQWVADLISSGLAVSVVTPLYVPVDNIVQRVQVGQFNSSLSSIGHIYKTEGLRGFWRGFELSLAMWSITSTFWWFSYETLKPLLYTFQPFGVSGEWSRNYFSEFLSGALAGLISVGIGNPLDIIKTRIQTETAHKSAFTVMKDLLKEEGPLALTKGLSSKLATRIPLLAVSSGLYEYILTMSEKPKET